MPQSVGSPRISVGRTVVAVGLLMGWNMVSTLALGQEASTTKPSLTEELLLSTSEQDNAATRVTDTLKKIDKTPSFEELDSAASDLNEALSGARAKLDELRQATELAAMAAELREELEDSIQENNRLAASLAELQSERSDLEAQNSEAQRKITELADAVERSNLEIAEQGEQLQRRQERIDEVDVARASAEEQVRQLETDLANTGDEVDQLRAEIAELTGQLEATRTELDEANGKAEESLDARSTADRELSKMRKQIAGMLRSVLLGGEPIDISQLDEEDPSLSEDNNFGLGVPYQAIRASNVRAAPDPDSERVGFAKRGDAITVLNKVADRNWFEIETVDAFAASSSAI